MLVIVIETRSRNEETVKQIFVDEVAEAVQTALICSIRGIPYNTIQFMEVPETVQ